MIRRIAALVFTFGLAFAAPAQSTSITYQGSLTQDGSAADGPHDFEFRLFTAATGGAQVGPVISTNDLVVANGLFTVALDFGTNFPGAERYLDIRVRPGASTGAYTTLNPRQRISAAPYALTANRAQTVEAGTISNPGFVGTTSSAPLNFSVNNQRALRLEYAAAGTDGPSPNLIGGFSGNVVSNGFAGAVIGGGGSLGYENRVGRDYATVIGGLDNTAKGYAATAGGQHTVASGQAATALGIQTTASGLAATALGDGATASGPGAVAMGAGTTAAGEAAFAMGLGSSATGDWSTALGSQSQAPGAGSAAIGVLNVANGYASAALGIQAQALHSSSFVWADDGAGPFASSNGNQFLIRAAGGVAIGTNNPAGAALRVVGTIKADQIDAGQILGGPAYLYFAETTPKGVSAGLNVIGGPNLRNFNTNVINTHNLPVSIVSGDLVLPAGTYQCRISAPAYRVDEHQTRLKNATANTILLYGTSEYSNNAAGPLVQSRSEIVGQFTLAAISTIQVQHFTLTAQADNGLGIASSATWTDGNPVEVYTIAEFWKLN